MKAVRPRRRNAECLPDQGAAIGEANWKMVVTEQTCRNRCGALIVRVSWNGWSSRG